MKTDQELLREFVASRAEHAFTELVSRHIGLVYSTACRETKGDATAAQDVTQLVFIELARKADNLQRHPTLAGWLYTSVRFVSANVRRSEQRRVHREEEAHSMNELFHSNEADPAWQELKPVLDDAMHELSDPDRTAVILRYFEGKNLREVGQVLRISENTARMRVDRALEKLQKLLARRGVTSTNSALAKTLTATAVVVPPAFVAGVAKAALAATAISTVTASTLFGIITMTKLKLIAVGAFAIAAGGLLFWEEHQRRSLADENAILRDQAKQIAALREENLRLSASIVTAEKFKHSELRELAQYRAQATTRTPSTANNSTSEKESWGPRFDALYKLGDGEVLRRVGRPFGPEREAFYRQNLIGPYANDPTPNSLFIKEDEKGRRGPIAYGSRTEDPTLSEVIRNVLGLRPKDFEGAEELLKLKISGDWVTSSGASLESRAAALESLLREATGRNIQIQNQNMERGVIVASGNFSLKDGKTIDVFAENKNISGGGSGNFGKFIAALGDQLNLSVMSVAELRKLQNEQYEPLLHWNFHSDSKLESGADRQAMIEKVLANLSAQTSLRFELQPRSANVWVVTEK